MYGLNVLVSESLCYQGILSQLDILPFFSHGRPG